MTFPRLDAAGKTDVGLKRTHNEDAFKILIPPPATSQHTLGALFMVADGMGGLGGGDLASTSTINEIIREYYGSAESSETPELRLQHSLEAANVHVRQQAQRVGLPYIGSTIAGLLVTSEHAGLVFNVGDSRVYRIRNEHIELISRDQSVMAEQIASGALSTEDAKRDRNSNLTAFIGQPRPLQPVFQAVSFETDDIFVVCTDGLWSLVEEEEIRAVVQKATVQQGTQKLIKLALKAGGRDNVTVIIIRIGTQGHRYRRWLTAIGLILMIGLLIGGLFVLNPNSRKKSGETSASDSSPTKLSATAMPDTVAEPALIVLSATPTHTFTPTDTPEPTTTATATVTGSPSATASPTGTATVTASATSSPTRTPTRTPTSTATPTPQPSKTPLPTATPTATATATSTGTATLPSTSTPAPTLEPTVTLRPELASSTPTATPTATPSATLTITPYPFFAQPACSPDDGVICKLIFRIRQLHQGLTESGEP